MENKSVKDIWDTVKKTLEIVIQKGKNSRSNTWRDINGIFQNLYKTNRFNNCYEPYVIKI